MASEAGFCMIEKSLFNKCLQNRRRHWANILVLGCMIADQQKYEKISSGSIQQCLLSHTRFYPRHRTSLSHSSSMGRHWLGGLMVFLPLPCSGNGVVHRRTCLRHATLKTWPSFRFLLPTCMSCANRQNASGSQ